MSKGVSVFLISFLIILSNVNSSKSCKKRETTNNNTSQITPDKDSLPLRLNKESLGHISWEVLHTFAASYPTKPTKEDQKQFKNLISAFTHLYPCPDCRKSFKLLISENPVKTGNREEVVNYICDIHNLVNKKLGKEIFDCKKAMDFWGGGCGCSGK